MRGGLHNPGPLAAPLAAAFFPAYLGALLRVPGRYYASMGTTPGTTGASKNYIYYLPFVVLVEREQFDRIAIEVTTGSEGSARLGIYRDNNLAPGVLLLDAGEISTDTAGVKEIIIDVTLTRGLWWLAGLFSGTPVVRSHSTRLGGLLGLGGPTLASGASCESYGQAFTYGPLPSSATPVLQYPGIPVIALRRA